MGNLVTLTTKAGDSEARFRGQAAIELAMMVPLFVVFFVAVLSFARTIFRAQHRLTFAERSVGEAMLAREGSTLPVSEHPCLEDITIENKAEVTFVTTAICPH